MELHHLLHLAAVYPTSESQSQAEGSTPPVLTRAAGDFTILSETKPRDQPSSDLLRPKPVGRIFAAGMQIIFAQRRSLDFIDPSDVAVKENWAGKACLETLKSFELEVSEMGRSPRAVMF